MASVLLAVELLLFEWKPRSLIPVALASVTAAVVRRYIIGLGPLFPLAAHPPSIGPAGVVGCVLAGLLAGGLSVALTQAVYAAEDDFEHVPIHWMWWPAIGGLVIGIGGWIFPPAAAVTVLLPVAAIPLAYQSSRMVSSELLTSTQCGTESPAAEVAMATTSVHCAP
jgi:CIC family chloride channel protein